MIFSSPAHFSNRIPERWFCIDRNR